MPQTSSGQEAPRPQRPDRTPLPPEVMDILVPSLKVGTAAGALGLFTGAAAGIVRSNTPLLFSLASGIQWFTLGSSFYASRRIVITAWGGDNKLTPADTVKASALAGGFSGFAGGLVRGPKNIVPGVIMFTLFGAAGQVVANAMPAKDTSKPKASWLASKWSPVTPLSDQEYEKMLEEKILKLEVEMALVDDNIAALRESASLPRTSEPKS